jgi:hypothetical protein
MQFFGVHQAFAMVHPEVTQQVVPAELFDATLRGQAAG